MSTPIKIVSFSGGEVSPLLYGRTDLTKYETGLRTLRNMIALRHGGATRRPGTQYVGTTLNNGDPVRLIPFIYNETGNGQSYVLEFGNLYVAFIQNGGYVLGTSPLSISLYSVTKNYSLYSYVRSSIGFNYISVVSNNLGNNIHDTNYWKLLYDWDISTGYSVGDFVRGMSGGNATGSYFICTQANSGINPMSTTSPYWSLVASNYSPYTIVSPFAQADLQTLNFSESADVLTIVHHNYAPRELRRLAATNWAFSTVVTKTATPKISNLSAYYNAGSLNYIYTVTGVSASGEESEGSSILVSNVIAASAANPVQLFWNTGGNSYSYYRVYMQPTSNSANIGGYIGSTASVNFFDTGINPDFTNTPPQANSLFASPNNYPSVVGFVQQRRFFANTINNPIGFWGSVTGSYSNFNTHVTPFDSDPIIGSIAGSEVNDIQAILELKFMLMMTAGAEIYVQGNGSGVVTPSSINASTQSQYGCSKLRPIKASDVIIFNQALGSYLRDFSFDFVISGYRGNDLSVFSSHLFEGSSLVDWDFQKIPDSILWAVRDDGILLGLTYVREQQILAWHRHDFQNGTVQNVCCIPENGTYAVYLTIERVINGNTVVYVERMSSRIWSDVLNATYLDCFSSYNGVNSGTMTMTLSSPSGSFRAQDDGTAYQQQLTLTASADYFNSGMVGDQIFLSDADFVENKGNMIDPETGTNALTMPTTGNQIRCTIISYTSPTQVTVTSNRAVSIDLQNTSILTWSRAVKKLTGLDYLIEQEVSVWADRFVVGSPLNSDLKTVYTVDSDGSITLDKCYSVIYVGLPITSDLETLDLETSFGETMLGRRKRTAKISFSLYQTRNLMGGSENPDSNVNNANGDPLFQLFELQEGTHRTTYDQPPEMVTDQDWVLIESRWNRNGRIFIRNVDPTPMTILAISPGGDYPVQSPYVKV
jgi:hypothetical protein